MLSRGDPDYVRLGELVLFSDEDEAEPQTLKIIEVILHPDYRTGSKYNDIGLVKMEKKVKLTPFIRPACLPTEFGGPETQAIASGWGHTEFGANEGASHLMKVILTKFSHRDCNITYVSELDLQKKGLKDGIREETQLCAGSRTAIKDTCQVKRINQDVEYSKYFKFSFRVTAVAHFKFIIRICTVCTL